MRPLPWTPPGVFPSSLPMVHIFPFNAYGWGVSENGCVGPVQHHRDEAAFTFFWLLFFFSGCHTSFLVSLQAGLIHSLDFHFPHGKDFVRFFSRGLRFSPLSLKTIGSFPPVRFKRSCTRGQRCFFALCLRTSSPNKRKHHAKLISFNSLFVAANFLSSFVIVRPIPDPPFPSILLTAPFPSLFHDL